jgi:hypothetical protein
VLSPFPGCVQHGAEHSVQLVDEIRQPPGIDEVEVGGALEVAHGILERLELSRHVQHLIKQTFAMQLNLNKTCIPTGAWLFPARGEVPPLAAGMGRRRRRLAGHG